MSSVADYYTLARIAVKKVRIWESQREDAIQYVVMKLWEANLNESAHTFKKLVTIACNKAKDYLRELNGRDDNKSEAAYIMLQDKHLNNQVHNPEDSIHKKIDLERLKASATPLTQDQARSANFYRRTLSSNMNLDKLGLDPDSLIGRTSYDYAPGLTQLASTDKRNAYRSAVENFISATLRLESGAAIGDAEFERQYRIFFPLSGAGPEEIEQKRKARELAIAGFKAEAGPGVRQAELDLAAQGYEIGG